MGSGCLFLGLLCGVALFRCSFAGEYALIIERLSQRGTGTEYQNRTPKNSKFAPLDREEMVHK